MYVCYAPFGETTRLSTENEILLDCSSKNANNIRKNTVLALEIFQSKW